MAATVDVEKKLDELIKQGASLRESVEEMQNPQLHLGSDDTVGYWGKSVNETMQLSVGRDGRVNQYRRSLPKGYKPFNTFKSYGEFIRDGFHNRGDFNKKFAEHTKSIQGMSTQLAGDGGALILPEFNMNLFERNYANDLWNRTDQYVVGGNNMVFVANAETSRVDGSRHGGLLGYWTSEGGSLTKSKPTIRRFSMNLKDLYVLVYLTNDLVEDGGPALEQYVTRKATEEFNFLLGNSVINGDGTGKPLGIMNSPSLLTITKETGQASATIVTENIDKMWARKFYTGNYAWYHNQDCTPQLDRLSQAVGVGGVTLMRPNNSLTEQLPQAIKTAPRIETEFNATLGTTGDILLADLGQYVTINKGGIAQAASIHVEFLTDQLALRFKMRCNGQPWENSPVTPFKGSNTQSHFLCIETR